MVDGAGRAGTVRQRRFTPDGDGCALSFLDHQIDGHLAFQATDVAMTEIITQFVDLQIDQRQGFN